jgi:hypothetical protein
MEENKSEENRLTMTYAYCIVVVYMSIRIHIDSKIEKENHRKDKKPPLPPRSPTPGAVIYA